MRTAAPLLLALLAGLSAQPSRADDTISPDRPSIANGPEVVGPAHWQIEAGVGGDKSPGEHGLGTPVMLRVGLSERWELRIDTAGRVQQSVDGAHSSGWGDSGLGAKWHLVDGEGTSPSIGLLGHLAFATGTGNFRGQGTRPEIDLALAWSLSSGYDASFMSGVYGDRNDAGKRYAGGVLAAGLGKMLNEQTHAFVEISAQRIASSSNGGTVSSFNTGLSYLLSRDVQVDAAVFRGLNHDTPDWQWTVGLSLRF